MAPSFVNEQSPYSTWSFMLANFATQYNFGSIAISLIVMSSSYCTGNQEDCDQGVQAGWVTGTSNGIMLLGAIVGQLTMGKLGDMCGRNNAFIITMTLATIGSLLSAVAPSGSAETIYGCIIGFRFILGLGLGGVYPLSATKAAEDSGSEDGNSVNSVAAAWAFFWQMPGVMGPYALAYLVSVGNSLSVNATWRLILGFGAVPAGLALILLILEKVWLHNNNRNDTPQLSPNNVRVISRRATDDPKFANVVKDNIAIKKAGLKHKSHEPLPQVSPGTSPPNSDGNGDLGIDIGGAQNTKDTIQDIVPPISTLQPRYSDAIRSSRSATLTSAAARTSVSSLTEDTQAPVDERGKRIYSRDNPSSKQSFVEALQEEYVQDPHLTNRFIVSGSTWFLFDIVVYGLGLFGPEIIYAISSEGSVNISSIKSMRNLTSGMLLVQAMGIPSTLLGIYLIPHISLKSMQVGGFALISIVCLVYGAIFNTLHDKSPTALYALFVVVGFFMQFLVNVTTFIMPAAVFRREVRATFNGISAAMGKAGAAIGAFAFPAIGRTGRAGVVIIMILCCVAGIGGALLTWLYLLPSMINDGGDSGQPISYGAGRADARYSDRGENSKSSKSSNIASKSVSEMELSKPHNIIPEHDLDLEGNGGMLNPIQDKDF